MRKTKWKTLLLLISAFLFIGGAATYTYFGNLYENHLLTPVDSGSSARINFSIEKGETGADISKRLEQLELIVSEWAFYKYIKEENIAPQLEAGKYVLKKSYTIPEIAQFLTKSRSDEVVLTIREGLTLGQVDAYLSEKKILPAGSFEQCAKDCPFEPSRFLDSKPNNQSLEGYLFADTYFIDPETANAQQLVERMLNNFNQKISGLISDIAKSGYSIHQIVTMASLIEKESRKNSEKNIISGILWKRLKEGMPLGVDATVRYAVDKWTEPLTITDLEIDSKYNTRRFKGLPPGPISNFSLSSLKAAINPEESEYYFYLHGNDGQIRYGRTNEEHNVNKKKYL
ncbi:MAG: endolytic transglycosylase MltG [Candidatus Gracilibacteria bacterium]|nr:endolytic transglycosylase MltG [Candidatus Gracilibacteria bacterium]